MGRWWPGWGNADLSRFLRFCLVGGSGVVVNYGVYLPLSRWTGAGPYLSEAVAFEVSVLSNFLLNEAWTFRDRSVGDAAGFRRRAGRFHVVSLGGLVLNLAVFACFIELVGLPDLVALLFGIGAATAWNFLANLRWTWASGAAPAGAAPTTSAGAGAALWRALGRARILLPLLVAAVWLASVGQYARRPGRYPADEEYRALAAVLDREAGPRDAVAIAPWWAERGRLYFGQHHVLGVRDPAAEDLSRHARLWLVGVFAEDANPVRRALAARYELLRSERFGHLTLDLFALPPPVEVLYDFWAELDRATVTVQGSPSTRCDRWRRHRWECRGPDWHFVGRLVTDVDHNPRRCIWAHPVQEGALEVSFADVPLGARLEGRLGLQRTGAGQNPAPVTLEVDIAGRPPERFSAPDQIGYAPFSLDTTDLRGQRRTVRFAVRAANVGLRHFCFEAATVTPGGAAASAAGAPDG